METDTNMTHMEIDPDTAVDMVRRMKIAKDRKSRATITVVDV